MGFSISDYITVCLQNSKENLFQTLLMASAIRIFLLLKLTYFKSEKP